MRVIYDYEAQGPDELSIREGEAVELSSGPYGGQNRADGWWEGEKTYPSIYLMMIDRLQF